MDEAIQLIRRCANILLVSHVQPDGDAVGSICATSLLLEQMGKRVYPYLKDPVPALFSFVPNSNKILPIPPDPLIIDLIIILDASDKSRLGLDLSSYTAPVILIDHHIAGDINKTTDYRIVDNKSSSTSSLVYQLAQNLNIKMSSGFYTAILTGLYTDTGGFQNRATTTEALDLASDLMKRGAKLYEISNNISHNRSLSSLKLTGIALNRIRISKYNIAWSYLTNEDLVKCQSTPEDVAGIIGEINALPNVDVSLLLTEFELGIIRCSMRSGLNSDTKVVNIAKFFQGGGHPRAAGFGLSGDIASYLPE